MWLLAWRRGRRWVRRLRSGFLPQCFTPLRSRRSLPVRWRRRSSRSTTTRHCVRRTCRDTASFQESNPIQLVSCAGEVTALEGPGDHARHAITVRRAGINRSTKRRQAIERPVVQKIEPESCASNPAIIRSIVVLPQPLGPSNAKNSFSRIDSERPSTAFMPPGAKVLMDPGAELHSGDRRPAAAGCRVWRGHRNGPHRNSIRHNGTRKVRGRCGKSAQKGWSHCGGAPTFWPRISSSWRQRRDHSPANG